MKIVIIEDEKPSARRLNRMVSALGLEVLVMLHSVEESVAWFRNNNPPDLLFLDVQLSDGLSFEIFEQINIKSPIIFTTAYDEYALKAFKLNSVDYLLKPIDEDELKTSIEKLKENRGLQLNISQLKDLLHPREYKKRIIIKIGQHLKIINTNEIECLFSENKATYLHSEENRNYLIDNSLDFWESELNPMIFFRVNRTFIVNINGIKDIISYSNSRLKLILNSHAEQEIIVSRERVKAFKQWIT